jgi:hypothetical protein
MSTTRWKVLAIFTSLVSTSQALPTTHAPCDKALLTSAADAYIASQTAGSISPLQSLLSPNFTYTENNKVIPHTSGVIHKPLKIDHRRTNYDLVDCATYTEVVAASGPYVIGTQIRHREDGKVVSIDTIATTTNAWLFNATKTLEYVKKETWEVIPEGKRDKREVIQAAGDAYMDMWNDAHAHERVPWGTPCVRLEGSAYTGTRYYASISAERTDSGIGKGSPDDSCKPGIPSNHSQAPNTHRRYVIDEAMGSVSIFCVWEHMMNAADSHEFRLENGKLRYVHTMTEVCTLYRIYLMQLLMVSLSAVVRCVDYKRQSANTNVGCK